MLRKVTMLLAICALSCPAFSASETFAGKWKFNPEKSDAKGRIVTIAALDNHGKFKLKIGDAEDCVEEDNTSSFTFTINTDGAEHVTIPGATWAVAEKNVNTWEVAYKSHGTPSGSAVWALSADGKSLSVKYNGIRHDGSAIESQVTLKRVSGSAGFAGTWQQMEATASKHSSLQIDASNDGRLGVSWPSDNVAMAVTLDGRDFAVEGPKVLEGSTATANWIDTHLIRMTGKVDGRLIDTTDWQLSSDGKVLTLTEHDPSMTKAVVSVYDRE